MYWTWLQLVVIGAIALCSFFLNIVLWFNIYDRRTFVLAVAGTVLTIVLYPLLIIWASTIFGLPGLCLRCVLG